MSKKKKKGIQYFGQKCNTFDRVKLALAFVGEHKQLFKEWVESKGGTVQESEDNDER